MTTIERFSYVGTRRFDAIPARARLARHRRRSRAVVALAAAAHRVHGAAGRAASRMSTEWEARVTLRALTVATVLAVMLGVAAGLAALAVTGPAVREHVVPTFQTPGPAAPTFTLPPR